MRPLLLILVALLAPACVSEEEIRPAIDAVNAEFKREYETVLDEIGSRQYPLSAEQALELISGSLSGVGMRIVSKDSLTGMLLSRAPAPNPLSDSEWASAAAIDEPAMQEIIKPHIGALPARFVKFEPEGLDILIRAVVIPVGDEVEISLTMRMEEIAPPPSGRPRREYAPPTAVRRGLNKIWAELERQLSASNLLP